MFLITAVGSLDFVPMYISDVPDRLIQQVLSLRAFICLFIFYDHDKRGCQRGDFATNVRSFGM